MPASTTTGQRIRLVVFAVEMSDDSEVNVSLRIPWTGAEPDHSCVADECDFCIGTAQRKANAKARKDGKNVTAQGGVTLLRDGQSRSF